MASLEDFFCDQLASSTICANNENSHGGESVRWNKATGCIILNADDMILNVDGLVWSAGGRLLDADVSGDQTPRTVRCRKGSSRLMLIARCPLRSHSDFWLYKYSHVCLCDA